MLRLFVGDDWASDHHDVEVMDSSGATLARARLPEGVAGMARLHSMIASHAGDSAEEEDVQVLVGIETGRGSGGAAEAGMGRVASRSRPPLQILARRSSGSASEQSRDASLQALVDDVEQLRLGDRRKRDI